MCTLHHSHLLGQVIAADPQTQDPTLTAGPAGPFDYITPMRMGKGQQWDPDGYMSTYIETRWSPFKQWDPGK